MPSRCPRGLGFEEALAWHGVTLDVDPVPCLRPTSSLRPLRSGYYASSFGGANRQLHVAAWMLRHGVPVPDGLEVRHLCGNGRRGCVNPYHLDVGTHAENMADARGVMPSGERHHHSRLTERDIREIRRLRGEGMLQREIGARFGIHQVHVSAILAGKLWRHVA